MKIIDRCKRKTIVAFSYILLTTNNIPIKSYSIQIYNVYVRFTSMYIHVYYIYTRVLYQSSQL